MAQTSLFIFSTDELIKKHDEIIAEAIEEYELADSAMCSLDELDDHGISNSKTAIEKLIDHVNFSADNLILDLLESLPVSSPTDSARNMFTTWFLLYNLYIQADEHSDLFLLVFNEIYDTLQAQEKVIFNSKYAEIFKNENYEISYSEELEDLISRAEELDKSQCQ